MINMNGPNCPNNPNANIFEYISSFNRFVNGCNMNPHLEIKYPMFIDPTVDEILNMDCEGQANGLTPYNFTKRCGLIETYSALLLCQEVNAEKMKRLVSTNELFLNVIYNLPISCPFYGLGSQGLVNGQGQIWIQGSRMVPEYANTFAHEYGHALGLKHAGAMGSTWEYADCSDPMGCASTINLCYNAPNANAIGWSQPIHINVDSSTRGIWSEYFLPIFTTAYYNNFLITVPGTSCDLFFSLRSGQQNIFADSAIETLTVVTYNGTYAPLQNSVSVHAKNQTSTAHSILVDVVPMSSIWAFDQIAKQVCGSSVTFGNIAIKHIQFIARKGSSISFCFYNKKVTDCK